MVVDYIYEFTDRFVLWLKSYKPSIVEALRDHNIQPLGYKVACRVYLDKYMQPTRHVLLFPKLPALADLSDSHKLDFDKGVDEDAPLLVLNYHPEYTCEDNDEW